MKAGWEIRPLGDICKFVRGPFGGSLKKDIFVQDGYAVYEQQHAIYNQFNEIRYFVDQKKFDEMGRFELRANDLIMSCSGTMGKVAIVPADIKQGIINQALLKLSPSNLLLPKFLKYWMESDSFQDGLKEQSGGAAIQNVASVAILKEIKIAHPVLHEQQRIVAKLDQAFEGIAKARANSEQNLQNARALFEGHLQSVFTKSGEDWQQVRLKDIAEYFNGLTYSPDNVKNSGTIVLRSSNVQSDKLSFNDIVRVNSKVKAKLYVQDGDILMCSRNGSKRLIGKTATISNLKEEMTFGTFMMIIRSKYNAYLAWFFKTDLFRKQISSGENTMINQITRYMLDDITLALPPSNLINEIVSNLIEYHVQIKKLEFVYQRKIALLDELKKSLLQQAFAGEL